MMKEQMEAMKTQNRKGGADKWEVDYKDTFDSANTVDDKEVMVDKAKSYSF